MPEPEYDLTTPQAKKAIGIANILVWFIPIGFLLMAASLLEGSLAWAGYICMTGWWGIVMGLNGAQTLKRQFLDPTSAEANASPRETQLWGLFMFWLPTLAAVALGGILHSGLEPDKRATGFIGPWFTIMQSLAMYFLAAGFAWVGVYGTARRSQAEAEQPAT